MKSLVTLSMMAATLGLVLFTSACQAPLPYPPRTDCHSIPGTDSNPNMHCDTYYYSADGSTESVSRDMITDIAQAEEQLLQSQARHYAEKFSLSEEQGLKIAKTFHDFAAIESRSDSDVADFARRLYGVNPSEIVSAVGAAQAGNRAPLESLIYETAQNFSTTPENMKRIVRSLHGTLLEEQGIRL